MSDHAPGLKRLRAQTGSAPTFACSNCRCKRFSQCTCSKGITSTAARSNRRKT